MRPIEDKDWAMRGDIYTDWYTCPKCKEDMIMDGASYCQECGAKIKWNLLEESDINRD